MNALSKAFGKDAADKMLLEWQSCLISSRNELRRRRPRSIEESPSDRAAYAKLVGTSRVLRTTAVHVRPGHIADFVALLKDYKAAARNSKAHNPF